MDRWRELGLTEEEWQDCVEAAAELREMASGHPTPSAALIAAQLAVAKAAERPRPPSWAPTRRVPLQ